MKRGASGRLTESEAEAARDAYDRLCADYGEQIAWGMIQFAPGSPQWREFEECWQRQQDRREGVQHERRQTTA